MDAYIGHLEEKLRTHAGPISPGVLAAIKRELETLAEGLDFLGPVRWTELKESTVEMIEEGRALAYAQGYDPESIRMIPEVNFITVGDKTNTFLPGKSFHVYARRSFSNNPYQQTIDAAIARLLERPNL